MHKTTLPVGIRSLNSWWGKGTLRNVLPFQRAEGQWDNFQQSLLIHSILANMPIPSLYFTKDKEDGEFVYSIIDGLQRYTTIKKYIDGEYPLHASTPSVEVDDVVYEIANLHFDDLSEECQDAILGARLSIFCIEDYTMEDLEEIFARLNASTPLTTIQKARTKIGSDLSAWCKQVNRLSFFTQSINLSVAQARKEADFETLLQGMLLLDARMEGYDYKTISMRDVTKYCGEVRDSYSADKKELIEEVIMYLSDAFPDKCKWLKKSNIPIAIVIAKIAIEQDIDAPAFKSFIDCFSNSLSPAFEANTGSGNIRRVKTEGRLNAVYSAFLDYFKLSEDEVSPPTYVAHPADEPAPVEEAVMEDESDDVVEEEVQVAESAYVPDEIIESDLVSAS